MGSNGCEEGGMNIWHGETYFDAYGAAKVEAVVCKTYVVMRRKRAMPFLIGFDEFERRFKPGPGAEKLDRVSQVSAPPQRARARSRPSKVS